MKKTLLALCMVLSLAACGDKTQEPQDNSKPVIKIGVTLPLTGDAAETGQAAKAGLEMILSDLKQKGLRYDYQLFFEDNQMNAMKTANNVNKFIYIDKVDAIFSMWNLMSNVASNLAKEHDVISFACAYGRTANNGKYSFNMQNTYEDQAELLVRELNKRNIKKIALFVDNSAIMEQYKVIEDYINNNSDIEIVFKEYFNPGEKDYRTAIAKASEKNPDIYMISGYPPSPYLFIKQLKEITGKNDNISSIDAIAEIGETQRIVANGLWYIDSNQNGLDTFQNRLLKEKNIQSQSCVGNVASNLEIFVAAMENAEVDKDLGKPSNDNINQWIFDNIKGYDTQSGKAEILNDGFISIKPTVKIIRDGKPFDIKE